MAVDGCAAFVGDKRMYFVNYYQFTTPSTIAQYSFDVCKTSNFDTKMALLSDCANSASLIACNDDGPLCLTAGYGSTIPLTTLAAGTTYYLLIGSYDASTTPGSGTLVVKSVEVVGGLSFLVV